MLVKNTGDGSIKKEKSEFAIQINNHNFSWGVKIDDKIDDDKIEDDID